MAALQCALVRDHPSAMRIVSLVKKGDPELRAEKDAMLL
jgi:hypothetical protein